MIRLSDATVLAVTKLRTRRIRTAVTVVVSGLLFGCLVAALCVAQGAFHSISQFNTLGLGSRYIAQAQADPPIVGVMQNKDIQDRATALYAQRVADKKAAAKKLGIDYDPATDKPPVTSPDGKSTDMFMDPTAPSAQQAIQEYMTAHPSPGLPDLQRVAAPYHPKDFFTTTVFTPKDGTLATMNNGTEDFSPNAMNLSTRYQNDILAKNAVEIVPPTLAEPFMLPKASLNKDHPDAIPVIVPYSVAEQILGMTPLPKNASPAQQLDHIKALYKTAGNGTFAACYRNDVSGGQVQTAISTAADIAKNKNNKDYQKPSLIYGLPGADSCGQAPVIRDVRTADEKNLAAKQKQFDALFGAATEPDQQKITFRIVGLMPDPQDGSPSNSAAGILRNLVGSSLAGIIAIPQDMYDTLPSVARYQALFTPPDNQVLFTPTTQYVEFYNDTDARHFIDNASCSMQSSGGCTGKERPFRLSAFGSNSIALRDLQRKFSRIFQLAALAVVVIAIIIMTGTVGRMIADSRRETAVFRAVGAERLDISCMYTIYVLLLSVCVAVFALVLGVVVARALDAHFWRMATAQALLAFGGSDLSLQFRLFQPARMAGLVLLAAIAAGLISMLLPLLRNIRRNPIRDMRDE